MIEVHVRLFAIVRDVVGHEEEVFSVPEGSSAADVARAISNDAIGTIEKRIPGSSAVDDGRVSLLPTVAPIQAHPPARRQPDPICHVRNRSSH